MADRSQTRRTVLRSSGAALSTIALAGCLGPLGGGEEASGRSAAIDRVPAGATYVAHADVETLLGDGTVRHD